MNQTVKICELTILYPDLELFHSSGWVHRDISLGNILHDNVINGWKLSDVEFAKEMNAKDRHEVRTVRANL